MGPDFCKGAYFALIPAQGGERREKRETGRGEELQSEGRGGEWRGGMGWGGKGREGDRRG
jgi:hypothetical protein